MKIVPPSDRASASTRATKADSTRNERVTPSNDWTEGRGRSPGRSSTGGEGVSTSRQKASWRSKRSPASHSRCQTA
jgi:hypothetical protein